MSHAQTLHEEKTGDQALCSRIADRVAQLLEPSSTHETQWVRVHAGPCPTEEPVIEARYRWQTTCDRCGQVLEPGTGQRLAPTSHVVERPSLVDQLEAAVCSATSGQSGAGYESRPVANLEALDALGTIEREAAIWARAITGRGAPVDLGALLGLLVERAPTMSRERIRALDFDVLRWWAHARVTTTWDTAPLKPHVPCMNCDRRGGIRVRVEPLSAACLNCGAAWDATTIGLLGNHIQLMMSPPIDLEAETAAAS